MKKLIIAGIAITASVALCAAVWPRNDVIRDLPAEPINAAVTAEIEAAQEERPQFTLSANGSEVTAESESLKMKRYTEINELSSELLNIFIEKIEVGERAEKYSRTAEQEIIIHYRVSASSVLSPKKPRK